MNDSMAAMFGGKRTSMQRVPTGIPGLDELLYGGFLEGDSVLVAGAPGTGKSTLGMQFLYQGILRFNEPGFFITFEEFPQQIYRDALNFGMDFRELEEEDKLKVLFTSPDLLYQDIKRQEGIFPEMIREVGAKRVVVDSVTHFQRLASDPGEWREIIYSLVNALKREGLTPILLRELVAGESIGTVAEEYIADAVLHLTMDRINGQRMRFVEVLKSRGSRHVPTKSLFFIHDEGLEVLPPYQEAFFRYQEAISVGIPDLDSLMGGGIPYGAFYLFEVSPEIHQEIFEVNFVSETFRAQDMLFELSPSQTRLERLKQLAQNYSLQQEVQQAIDDGYLRIIDVFDDLDESGSDSLPRSEEEEAAESDDDVLDTVIRKLDEAFQETSSAHRGRLFLDVTRLLTAADDDFFFTLLSPVLDMIHQYGGVCLGFLNPEAVPASAREKLATEADGIVRMWKQGTYSYVQVVKTVNSVLTPINSLIETNTPPYLKIIPY
ncbi:MAG: ATPase domain-containing protein [Armatimonadota bacterium]